MAILRFPFCNPGLDFGLLTEAAMALELFQLNGLLVWLISQGFLDWLGQLNGR